MQTTLKTSHPFNHFSFASLCSSLAQFPFNFIDSVHDAIIEPCMVRNKLSNHRFGVIKLKLRSMFCCTTFHHHVVHINRKSAREARNIKLSLTAALAWSVFHRKYSWLAASSIQRACNCSFSTPAGFDVEALFFRWNRSEENHRGC